MHNTNYQQLGTVYRPWLIPCLVPRPHYCAQPMRFGLRHQNAMTEKAWKDAAQGLGKLVPNRLYLYRTRQAA